MFELKFIINCPTLPLNVLTDVCSIFGIMVPVGHIGA